MPRYFFNAQDGRPYPDDTGIELAGPDEAQVSAVKALTEMVREFHDEFVADEVFTLTVTDEDGLVLYRLDLAGLKSPALDTPPKGAPRGSS
jgi:hypothetical protein